LHPPNFGHLGGMLAGVRVNLPARVARGRSFRRFSLEVFESLVGRA